MVFPIQVGLLNFPLKEILKGRTTVQCVSHHSLFSSAVPSFDLISETPDITESIIKQTTPVTGQCENVVLSGRRWKVWSNQKIVKIALNIK